MSFNRDPAKQVFLAAKLQREITQPLYLIITHLILLLFISI